MSCLKRILVVIMTDDKLKKKEKIKAVIKYGFKLI